MTYNNSCFKAILGSQEICKIGISVLMSVLTWKAGKGGHSFLVTEAEFIKESCRFLQSVCERLCV